MRLRPNTWKEWLEIAIMVAFLAGLPIAVAWFVGPDGCADPCW